MPRHLTTFQSRQSKTTKLKLKDKEQNSNVFFYTQKVKTTTQKSTLAGQATLTTPTQQHKINIYLNNLK